MIFTSPHSFYNTFNSFILSFILARRSAQAYHLDPLSLTHPYSLQYTTPTSLFTSMVSFSYYYFNARSSHLLYLSTLLTLTTYHPFSSVLFLSGLDSILGYLEWSKYYKASTVLEFTIAWELKKESPHYKWSSVFLHFFVLLPYVVLWLWSYGQNCIGVSVLAYALFVFAVTCHGIMMYDGAAHKGLDPKIAPKIHLKIASTDRTEFVLSNLYTIAYLTYEEESKGTDPSNVKPAVAYVDNPKYTHLAWRLVKHLHPSEIRQLRNYLLFSDEKKQ